MKLKSLEIEAFRGFGGTRFLTLNGDVVLLSGRNGFGKTSVFDAISWCLFGSSQRFEGTRDFTRADASYIGNAFSGQGRERVRLIIADEIREIAIERISGRLSLFDGQRATDGETAQRAVIELLGFRTSPEEPTRAAQRRARDSFNRSFCLQQDFLSSFVLSKTPRERFDAFADLFSLSPIRDFHTYLSTERGKGKGLRDEAFRRLDVAGAELGQLQRQLTQQQARVDRIFQDFASDSTPKQEDRDVSLEGLALEAAEIVGKLDEDLSDLDKLDRCVIALGAFERSQADQIARLDSIRRQIPLLMSWQQELEQVTKQLETAQGNIKDQRKVVLEAEAKMHSVQASLAEADDQLTKNEASKARMHAFLRDAIEIIVADACPVCERPMARDELLDKVRDRLDRGDPESEGMAQRRLRIREELNVAEQERTHVGSLLANAERDLEALFARQEDLGRSIADFRRRLEEDIEAQPQDPTVPEAVDERLEWASRQAARASELRQRFEQMRPSFELAETRQAVRDLERDVAHKEEQVRAVRRRVAAYDRVDSTLEAVILGSRRAERSIVEEFVSRFRVPIREAYQWLAPHPLFQELDFEFSQFDEAGELYFQVSRGDVRLNPATVFSAAQANALALGIFLSLNAAIDWSPLQVMLIDDPVQNMDDVNVLSLVDLLRTRVGHRQLILSTSVPHLYRLFADKLRPTREEEELVVHRFEALTEEGPTIETDVIHYQKPRRALPDLIRLSA